MEVRTYCLTDLELQLLIDEFDTRDAAEIALAQVLRDRPTDAGRIGILRFDAAGRQVDGPILVHATAASY